MSAERPAAPAPFLSDTGAPPPRRGRIVFLNGTSSSGKSSIARELLDILDEPAFHLPVDAFHAMRSRRGSPRRRWGRCCGAPGWGSTGPSRAWRRAATTWSSTMC